MEFVKDDGADPGQLGIKGHLAQQDSLGDEADPRPLAHPRLEADLVADEFPEACPRLLGDTAREHAGGEPARLEDDDLAGSQESVP